MNYDDFESKIDADGNPVLSAEAESEAAQKEEYFGHHISASAPSGERRAATSLWLVSYADFMTILLIFFLAMYGYTYLARATLIVKRTGASQFSTFTKMAYSLKNTLGQNMDIEEDLKKVTLQLKDQVLFPSGKSALNANAKTTLDDLAKSLKLVEGPIIVEGHTDNVPIIGGRYPSNWELSAARSFSVIEALTQRGVNPAQLSAWGFGDTRPIAGNDTPAGRSQNRRIEIVAFKKAE